LDLVESEEVYLHFTLEEKGFWESVWDDLTSGDPSVSFGERVRFRVLREEPDNTQGFLVRSLRKSGATRLLTGLKRGGGSADK
jgi:hypothetical protein